MSGHSKWHSIKHKKAREDAKRGKAFTKVIKEITVAARLGGGDLSANPRLRTAVDAAKEINMPKDNIEKAIKKGTGELEGVNYEEAVYEGYGPEGVAIFVESLTDNKNRTTSEIRHIFSKFGGNLGSSGCVSWMFERKGVIILDAEKNDEETVFNIIIESGADDMSNEDGEFEILTSFESFFDVKKSLEDNNIEIKSAEISMIPKNRVKVSVDIAKKVLNLSEALENNDDVQNVYANIDLPDELMNEL